MRVQTLQANKVLWKSERDTARTCQKTLEDDQRVADRKSRTCAGYDPKAK